MNFISVCSVVGLLVVSTAEGRRRSGGRNRGRGRLMRASLKYNHPPDEFVEKGKEAVWRAAIRKECGHVMKDFTKMYGRGHCDQGCSETSACGDLAICCKVGKCAAKCHPLIYEFQDEEVVFNKLLDDTVDGMTDLLETGLSRLKAGNYEYKDLVNQANAIGQKFMDVMVQSETSKENIRRVVDFVVRGILAEVDQRILDSGNTKQYEKALTSMIKSGETDGWVANHSPEEFKSSVGMVKKMYMTLPVPLRAELLKMGMERARRVLKEKGRELMVDEIMARLTRSGASPLMDRAVPIIITEAKGIMKDAAKNLINGKSLLKASKAAVKGMKKLGSKGIKTVGKAAKDVGKAAKNMGIKIGNMGRNAAKKFGKLFG